MAHQLKTFTDRDLKNPVRKFIFPRTEIGMESEIPFYIYNESEKWPILEIEYNKIHKDVFVEKLPQILKPKETVQCFLVYKPSKDTNEPVSTIADFSAELHIG